MNVPRVSFGQQLVCKYPSSLTLEGGLFWGVFMLWLPDFPQGDNTPAAQRDCWLDNIPFLDFLSFSVFLFLCFHIFFTFQVSCQQLNSCQRACFWRNPNEDGTSKNFLPLLVLIDLAFPLRVGSGWETQVVESILPELLCCFVFMILIFQVPSIYCDNDFLFTVIQMEPFKFES